MKSEEWDNKERKIQERNDHTHKGIELAKVYKPLVEKYAKLNNIELVNDNGDPVDYYDFLYDAKFIDFAYDESGIIFNDEMFTLDDEFTDEDLKKLGSE